MTDGHIDIPQTVASRRADDPDDRLIKRLGAGDPFALQELMDLHMTSLHHAASYILRDKMAAEDAVQMSFLQLWKTAPNWQSGRGTVRAYLYRVMNHRCLDMLRKRKEILPGEVPDMIDTSPDPLDQLSRKDFETTMNQAISNLAPRQKMAIGLFYYQHQSLKEAAQSLDMTPAAFESLLRRARNSLKPLLSHMETLS